MRILRGFASGLAGLASYWLASSLCGADAPIWAIGKSIFSLYFSLFAFAILFAPVYFFGLTIVFKFGKGFKFFSTAVAYSFLFGLGIYPALMIGDMLLSFTGPSDALNNNAIRLSSLMVIVGLLNFVFSAVSVMILSKVIVFFLGSSGGRK
jgi:hypothetical protein